MDIPLKKNPTIRRIGRTHGGKPIWLCEFCASEIIGTDKYMEHPHTRAED